MPRFLTELAWDTAHFGFGVAELLNITSPEAELPLALDEARAANIALAYWKTRFGDNQCRAAARSNGGSHINSKVELISKLQGNAVLEGVVPVTLPDAELRLQLKSLALASGWSSRFALDPRFPPGSFEALYAIWMENSLEGTAADVVLAAKDNGRIIGMVTIAAEGKNGRIGLFGVEEKARGRGVGSRLLNGAAHWCAEAGCSTISVATQGNNEGAIAIYQRHGFAVSAQHDVFHFWM